MNNETASAMAWQEQIASEILNQQAPNAMTNKGTNFLTSNALQQMAPLTTNASMPISTQGPTMMDRLVADQVMQIQSQPKPSWIKESTQNPLYLAAASFVLTMVLLIVTQPIFVTKSQISDPDHPEQDLHVRQLSMIRVFIVSLLAAAATYSLPLLVAAIKPRAK